MDKVDSYIHVTKDYQQFCHIGGQVDNCKLVLFEDAAFAVDLRDSKSTSGGVLCTFGI